MRPLPALPVLRLSTYECNLIFRELYYTYIKRYNIVLSIRHIYRNNKKAIKIN